jgi:hypothetical protein
MEKQRRVIINYNRNDDDNLYQKKTVIVSVCHSSLPKNRLKGTIIKNPARMDIFYKTLVLPLAIRRKSCVNTYLCCTSAHPDDRSGGGGALAAIVPAI